MAWDFCDFDADGAVLSGHCFYPTGEGVAADFVAADSECGSLGEKGVL